MATSDQILSVFKQFCEEYKTHFYQIDEGVFTMNVWSSNARLEVRCYVGDTYLLFSSLLPVPLPPEKQHAVMEFITLANFGRIIGSFEMDLKNGIVAFKTDITVIDAQLTTKTLYVLLGENICTADHYLKGIYQITHANMQPSVAIRKLERSETGNAEADEELRELLNDPAIDEALGKIDD